MTFLPILDLFHTTETLKVGYSIYNCTCKHVQFKPELNVQEIIYKIYFKIKIQMKSEQDRKSKLKAVVEGR